MLPKFRLLKNASWLIGLLWPVAGLGQTAVTTYHYDNGRTGQNTLEFFLTPASANPNQFRRLFFQLVDGQVYAQPLYLVNVVMGPNTPQAGTVHNLVFVATQNDSVYAFDADNNQGANGTSLWHANLLDSAHGASPGATTVPQGDAGIWCSDITPQIGITSTPVLDPASATLYVVSKSKENVGGVTHYVLRLHALDISTGTERNSFGSPVVIGDTTFSGTISCQASDQYTNNTAISVTGVGDGSDGTTLRFNALRQNQRVGLLLQNGVVYLASGSHCDCSPFHGWVMAYDARTLKLLAVFNTTPNGSDGGIWMEGAGLAADQAGNIFVATGNGTFDTALDAQGFPNQRDFGDSILKLDANLHMLDYFTPFNQAQMDGPDQDLGSGGVLLIPDTSGPHPHLLTQAGKLGIVYVLDRDQLTAGNQHFCAGCTSDTNIVQELTNTVACTAVPVSWNGAVYFRGDCDAMKAFTVANGQLSTPPLATSDNYPGKMAISAKGNANGIVWTLDSSGQANSPEILNAYDAVNLSLLYSSNSNLSRDNPGNAVTWPSPVEVNGRVYLGAADRLSVYGLFGIGGYDLESAVDRSFAFDYSSSGKLDHLALYRPGTGTIWILRNNAGTFKPVYQQGDPGSGIGGYDLKSLADQAFAFDYDGSGRADHMVLYRPGTGTIWILRNFAGRFVPVYQQSASGNGIGGYNLLSAADRAFAFDYDGSGKLDHLVLYRPGTGMIWILKNNAGTFTPVYQQGDPGSGIGGYDLKSAADRAFAFDDARNGKSDHLALYRPGTGTIWILENNAGSFSPVYQQGDPGAGIGGYDLKSAVDAVASFDYDGSGRSDHLMLDRAGAGKVSILRNDSGMFSPLYQAWEHNP